MRASDVTAVVVTRGGCNLAPVVESLRAFLPEAEIAIWDNSKRLDLKVYGRYAAVLESSRPIIYTQDDDCVVDASIILHAYEPGRVVCNMPDRRRADYPDGIALVGWGACFDAELVHRMDSYVAQYGMDELFYREADRVFTAVNEVKRIETPFVNLPWAYEGRMGNEARHAADIAEIRRRLKAL